MLIGELAGIASAALWALTSSAFGGLARRVPPVALSGLRLLCGVLFYAVLLAGTGQVEAVAQLGWDRVLALVMVAWIGLGLGDTLYIAGVQTLGVGRASPVSVTSYPLITIVVAWLALGEALTGRTALAAGLIVTGICLVVATRSPSPSDVAEPELALVDAPDAAPLIAAAGSILAAPRAATPPRVRLPVGDSRLWTGLALVLASSSAWAVSTVWLRALSLDTPVIVLNAVRVPAAAALLSLAALRQGSFRLRRYTRADLALVLFAGIVGTGVGTLLFVFSLEKAGAVRATLLNSLMPVFALPIAVRLLGERITRLTVLGTAVSLLGVWLVIG